MPTASTKHYMFKIPSFPAHSVHGLGTRFLYMLHAGDGRWETVAPTEFYATARRKLGCLFLLSRVLVALCYARNDRTRHHKVKNNDPKLINLVFPRSKFCTRRIRYVGASLVHHAGGRQAAAAAVHAPAPTARATSVRPSSSTIICRDIIRAGR